MQNICKSMTPRKEGKNLHKYDKQIHQSNARNRNGNAQWQCTMQCKYAVKKFFLNQNTSSHALDSPCSNTLQLAQFNKVVDLHVCLSAVLVHFTEAVDDGLGFFDANAL